MKLDKMKEWVAAGNMAAVETAWLEAVETGDSLADMTTALEMLSKGGKSDVAGTCAQMLVDDRMPKLQGAQALEFIKAVALAVPDNSSFRSKAAELYKQIYGDKPNFADFFQAAGLEGVQSNRRAFRTLDTCLSLQTGDYLANRFEHNVVRVDSFDAIALEFVLADERGHEQRLECKALADEFDRVESGDFRVLTSHRRPELGRLLKDEPVAVLIGICQMRGGSIDANALKEMLTDGLIAPGSWSGWWNTARNAAKRCPHLAVESGKPIVISYHPHGLTLEDEMAGAFHQAKSPMEKLSALLAYAREAKARKTPPDADFARAQMNELAALARDYKTRRPADALAASLALQAAIDAGLPAPSEDYPAADDILAHASKPADAVADLDNEALWPAAMDALCAHGDAVERLRKLLGLAPTAMLDQVAQRLMGLNRADLVEQAVAAALAKPTDNLEAFLWLWKGPAVRPANTPSVVELLTRLLNAVQAVDREWEIPQGHRRGVYQKIRTALAARDFGVYKDALAQMDEAVAGTIKRLIERTDGLADAVRGDMMALLRERFFNLFVKARIEPWLDETIIWATAESIATREKELKELVEVKMLENSRAIGAAAALGDLSENSEWKFAVEEREMLGKRAGKMQEELTKARPIHPDDVPAEYVGVGSRVILKALAGNGQLELNFLGPWDASMEKRIYSYQSQMAQDLMGKRIGDTVSLRLEGCEGDYVIESLGKAL